MKIRVLGVWVACDQEKTNKLQEAASSTAALVPCREPCPPKKRKALGPCGLTTQMGGPSVALRQALETALVYTEKGQRALQGFFIGHQLQASVVVEEALPAN